MKKLLIIIAALAALSGVSGAVAVGMGWVEFKGAEYATNPCRAGHECVYPSSVDHKPHAVDSLGNELGAWGSGGGGSGGGVTSIGIGTGLSSTQTPLSSIGTMSIANTAVSPGTYTYGSFTVNAQGQLTAASSGATPVSASRLVSAGSGLAGGGDLSADRTISLDLAHANTWTKAQTITPVALVDGATITVDLSQGDSFFVTLGGNRTIALSNLAAGSSAMIELIQDGTGSRTITWDAAIHWPGGAPPTLTASAGQADVISCKGFSGTTMLCVANTNLVP